MTDLNNTESNALTAIQEEVMHLLVNDKITHTDIIERLELILSIARHGHDIRSQKEINKHND